MSEKHESYCDTCFDEDPRMCGEINADGLDEDDPLVDALLMDGCECACHDPGEPGEETP